MLLTTESSVFIVEDDTAICRALTELFKSVHLPVKIYNAAQDFLDDYDANSQGCLLIDVRLPFISGFDLIEKLQALDNKLPIIMMTGYGDVPMAVRAIKAGAVDFVMKPFNNQILVELVQRAINSVPASYKTPSSKIDRQQLNSLTEREREVLEHLTAGKLNKEIAAELKISISTVEAHRARIMEKMQAKNIAELIKKYVLLTHI